MCNLRTKHSIAIMDQLLSLIRDGENEKVEEILKSSNYYQSTDGSGATLFHYSAQYGNSTVTQFLLDNGCNINAQDASGNTPLMIATNANKIKIVEILLDNAADPCVLNHEKKNVLNILSTNHGIDIKICMPLLHKFRKRCCNSEEAAEKLINAGIDIYLAAYLLDYKVIRYMIERGCSVNSMHPVIKMTALHVMVFFGNSKSVKILLEHGANPKALNCVNVRPLFLLYQHRKEEESKRIEILKQFLSLKISPMLCGLNGAFDLSYALIYGNREAIRVILATNPDFSVSDKIRGRTFMHYLAQNTNPEVVKELADTSRYALSAAVSLAIRQ